MTAKTDVSLHNLIRDCRRLSRLSQHALAKLAGVGKTAVFDLEHGKESVRFDTLLKILKVLNIKISFEAPPTYDRGVSSQSPGGSRR